MSDLRDELAQKQREREHAFQTVAVKHAQLQQAKAEYDEALLKAHVAGVTTTRMAIQFGQSETAVRSYIKRRLEKQ